MTIGVSVSSNWPLRGGKATLFEGGVRGVSFVTGGYVPASARGATRTALMQHVDIPTTMAKLAGAPWTRGTPDGLDIWDAIVHGGPSPRTEVPIAIEGNAGGGHSATGQFAANNITALIVGDYKIVFGFVVASAFWQGPGTFQFIGGG